MCATLTELLKATRKSGLILRDLNPGNIFFRALNSNADVCIIDFGAVAFTSEGSSSHSDVSLPSKSICTTGEYISFLFLGESLGEMVGSVPYMSPNMIRGCYGIETDMWSLGIILYRLLIGQELFTGKTDDEIKKKISEFEQVELSSCLWATISDDAKAVLSKLLILKEGDRFTPKELLGED